MHVRAERPEDRAAVRAVNLAAFDTAAEANLVDALRDKAQSVVSLVAEEGKEIVGHIMFSPVTMYGGQQFRLIGLAPMAVVPARQRQGVGAALVHTGIARCTERGFGAVVVLGHRSYYPRFGFQPSIRFGITSEYEAPAEAFMVLELQPGYLSGITGVVRYHAAFKDV
jgi:putative acetyltransferase